VSPSTNRQVVRRNADAVVGERRLWIVVRGISSERSPSRPASGGCPPIRSGVSVVRFRTAARANGHAAQFVLQLRALVWQATTMPVGLWVMRTAVEFFCRSGRPRPPSGRRQFRCRCRDVDFHIVHFGQHHHSGGGVWMRPALRWWGRAGRGVRRIPISASRTHFALDLKNDFLIPAHAGLAGRHHFRLPALALGVAAVHAEQVAANSPASSPPVPARTSTKTFFSSRGSLGTSML